MIILIIEIKKKLMNGLKDPLNNYVKKLSKNNKKFFKIKEKIDKQNIAKIKGAFNFAKK